MNGSWSVTDTERHFTQLRFRARFGHCSEELQVATPLWRQKVWNSDFGHELCAPVGVNEPSGSKDGEKCRKTFDDATRRDVPDSESERKPTSFLHHCEKVLVFASSH